MTSTVGRLRADSSRVWSRPGATTRTRPLASSARSTVASSLVLIASRPKVSMTLTWSSTELGGQRATQGESLHLARQPLLVRARVRPEDGAATAVVRCAARALAGAAGALLAVRLGATAADLAAGLGVVGARPARGQLGGHDLVEHGGVDRGREELIAEVHAADGLAGPVVEGGRRHRQAFFTRISDPRAPGRLPLTSSRLRSVSARTTRTFLMVTRSSPMWPAIFRPR